MEKTYTAGDYLRACDVCRHVLKNLEIHFQMKVEDMPRPDAVEHFRKRAALIEVTQMLCDEGESAPLT